MSLPLQPAILAVVSERVTCLKLPCTKVAVTNRKSQWPAALRTDQVIFVYSYQRLPERPSLTPLSCSVRSTAARASMPLRMPPRVLICAIGSTRKLIASPFFACSAAAASRTLTWAALVLYSFASLLGRARPIFGTCIMGRMTGVVLNWEQDCCWVLQVLPSSM